jgi:hypothetical protein
MTFVAALIALYLIGEARAAPWLVAVYLLSLAWFGWIFGAIWRAAGCYEGPRVWALLARAGVCVGVLRMALEAAAIAALVGS